MGRIATEMADKVIITSDNCRSEDREKIISDIISGIGQEARADYTVIYDRAEAIEYAVKNARAGDVILLAGKGHESYIIDEKGKHYFSERETLIRAVEKYF
jgi:UDP-N-acetylmuramoyl-L-alanyl-D-glutamate--2,6-diaminopimelate ligase